MVENDITTVEELQSHWRDHYKQWWYAGMPSYRQESNELFKKLKVNFKTREDREHFEKTLGIELTEKTDFIHYPHRNKEINIETQYKEVNIETVKTKYPIYIISKGRASYGPHTARALHSMGVHFYITVEQQDYESYKNSPYINEDQILVLPFSNHGLGSGPARNWCWEHSKANGFARHWLLDDNINEFWRLHKNKRYRVGKGAAPFRSIEDFVDRYENIALVSLQYKSFAMDKCPYPPYVMNSRVMSCILIDNNIDIRWRGKYNEDVDLSIRALKEGYVTLLVYAFLCGKLRTGTVKGGNTEEIYNNYQDDASYKKSKMLLEMHPDCVELVERYGRAHHHVNLNNIINKHTGMSARQNKPILKKDVVLHNSVNNYGLELFRNYGTENEEIDYSFSLNEYPKGRKSIHE
jgi:hypothetical protein